MERRDFHKGLAGDHWQETLAGGHIVHVDNQAGFTNAVKEFLQGDR